EVGFPEQIHTFKSLQAIVHVFEIQYFMSKRSPEVQTHIEVSNSQCIIQTGRKFGYPSTRMIFLVISCSGRRDFGIGKFTTFTFFVNKEIPILIKAGMLEHIK